MILRIPVYKEEFSANVDDLRFRGGLMFKVGDGDLDNAYWGRPEDMNMSRPAYKISTSKPGSDVASQVVAALAAGSMAFKDKGWSTLYILEH